MLRGADMTTVLAIGVPRYRSSRMLLALGGRLISRMLRLFYLIRPSTRRSVFTSTGLC